MYKQHQEDGAFLSHNVAKHKDIDLILIESIVTRIFDWLQFFILFFLNGEKLISLEEGEGKKASIKLRTRSSGWL